MVETAHAQWKIAKIDDSDVERQNFPRHIGNRCRWIHFQWQIYDRKKKLMHLRGYADIIVMFETDSIGQTPSSLERYLAKSEIM